MSAPAATAAWISGRVRLPSSWDGHRTVDVFVRQAGEGTPVVYLHGGWGYEAFPFDAAAHDLAANGFRCIAPDRTGYGRSTVIGEQPLDFHRRAAAETRALLDALGLESAILWGHSDGAVIAAWLGLEDAKRFPVLVLESLHVWPQKAGSRTFFEKAANGTLEVGARTQEALEKDHGPRWRDVVRMNGRVWVRLGEGAPGPHEDLYGGALARIRSATLLLHGTSDPRTEPGEMGAAHRTIAGSEVVRADARHCPHAEAAAWARARGPVLSFLDRVRPQI